MASVNVTFWTVNWYQRGTAGGYSHPSFWGAREISPTFIEIVTPAVVEFPILESAIPPDAPTNVPGNRDLAFDRQTLQFFRDQYGRVPMTTGIDAIRQACEIMLNMTAGEYFLDLDAGIPWFDRVLVKAPDLKAIEALLRSKLLGVPGIRAVTSLTLIFDRQNRTLSGQWVASSDLGEITAPIIPTSQTLLAP